MRTQSNIDFLFAESRKNFYKDLFNFHRDKKIKVTNINSDASFYSAMTKKIQPNVVKYIVVDVIFNGQKTIHRYVFSKFGGPTQLHVDKEKWYVYMLEVRGGSYYTGITNDIWKRMIDHNSSRGSKYVRSRRPFRVRYMRGYESRSCAQKEEARIKKLRHNMKEKLIWSKQNILPQGEYQ